MTELRSLAGDVLAGNSEAFDLLYDRLFPPIYRFAELGTASQAEARQLCQEIFEDVFQNLTGAVSEASFEAWVYRCARRVAGSHGAAQFGRAGSDPAHRASNDRVRCAAGK